MPLVPEVERTMLRDVSGKLWGRDTGAESESPVQRDWGRGT